MERGTKRRGAARGGLQPALARLDAGGFRLPAKPRDFLDISSTQNQTLRIREFVSPFGNIPLPAVLIHERALR